MIQELKSEIDNVLVDEVENKWETYAKAKRCLVDYEHRKKTYFTAREWGGVY